MTDPTVRRQGFSLLGIGAVACAACCAGPLLGLLGGLSLAGLASTAVLGAAGLVIAVAAAVAYLIVRRHRERQACNVNAAVSVELRRRHGGTAATQTDPSSPSPHSVP